MGHACKNCSGSKATPKRKKTNAVTNTPLETLPKIIYKVLRCLGIVCTLEAVRQAAGHRNATTQPSLARSIWLTLAICRLVILATRAHAVHGLALLGALVYHSGSRRSSWARIAIRTGAGVRRHRWWNELGVCTWIHHLRSSNRTLRSRHELRLHHHRSLLRVAIVRAVGKAPILSHLRVTWPHIYRLIVGHLARRIDTRIGHWHLAHARRRKRL